MPFKKGEGGRPRGTPNKATAALKDMILQALANKGGVRYLEQQAVKNPNAFMQLVGKVLPLQVAGPSGTPASPRRVIIELDDVGGSSS